MCCCMQTTSHSKENRNRLLMDSASSNHSANHRLPLVTKTSALQTTHRLQLYSARGQTTCGLPGILYTLQYPLTIKKVNKMDFADPEQFLTNILRRRSGQWRRLCSSLMETFLNLFCFSLSLSSFSTNDHYFLTKKIFYTRTVFPAFFQRFSAFQFFFLN